MIPTTTGSMRLGICIPTYKRPEQLEKCVLSLIAAAAPFAVPIFIADDSADDTNTEVYARLHALYPHIVVERNPKNLGIDRNILRCADMCSCEYAWLIGEDDRMVPEAVAVVLPLLEDAPAFVAVNYSYVDADFQVVLRETLMPLTADRHEPAAQFFRDDAWAIGFLGACVINKALWRSVSPDQYLGTYFAHVGVILESIAGREVCLVARPLVLNRVGGPEVFTWSADAYGVYGGFPQAARLLTPVYGAEAAAVASASFVRCHGLETLRFLLAKRADRVYTLDVYRRLVQGSAHSRLYKLAAHLVARTHPLPFRLMRDGLARVRRGRGRKLVGYA